MSLVGVRMPIYFGGGDFLENIIPVDCSAIVAVLLLGMRYSASWKSSGNVF